MIKLMFIIYITDKSNDINNDKYDGDDDNDCDCNSLSLCLYNKAGVYKDEYVKIVHENDVNDANDDDDNDSDCSDSCQ